MKITTNKTLTKSATFTDIHWGKKANSDIHNEDCYQFIEWFCEQVESDPSIDHIMFLGDWFENRSAINLSTLKWAHRGAKKLSQLGLPIFFVVGNHDLYHRHSREVHSVINYSEFQNFNIIEEPTIVENIGATALVSPYLFHNEYPDLKRYLNLPTWWGHFEFKGFEVTGYGMRMPTGPEAIDYQGPKHIFSGHFHKRQAHEQIVYIGNTFPMDFGDAGDNERGMMVYDHETDETLFHNWDACPKYTKTTLSDILDKTVVIHPHSRVKCIVDIEISYEESTHLKQKFQDDFQLRELIMEESPELSELLSGTKTNVDASELGIASVDELVVQMLHDIDSDKINNDMLVDIYKGLKQ